MSYVVHHYSFRLFVFFFFFKQKTAYEMRISDWSSDVCSSDLFIVGLPRSGSTLVEQILASHPGVEGLGELFDMERLLLEFTAGSGAGNWLEAVGRSNSDSLRALGADYLRSAANYSRTDRTIFTDKMPQQIGKDARRERGGQDV